MLIDSHCHLSFKELGQYDLNAQDYLNLAKKENVEILLDVILDLDILKKALDFSKNKSMIYNSFGIHPLSVNKSLYRDITENDLEKYIKSSKKIIGVGETGLDFHLSDSNEREQIKFFEMHCNVASKLNLPLIIHCRNASKQIISILKKFVKNKNLKGIIHCFTEDKIIAKSFLDLGLYISFSGIVTFKNAIDIKEAAKYIPIDKLLIETDSPFLAPVPFRGKNNQPSYIRYIAEYISMLRNISFEKLTTVTSINFKTLFEIN